MVNYKDLGLVNTRDMFAKAIKGGYAIPAFNFRLSPAVIDCHKNVNLWEQQVFMYKQ